MCCIQWWWGHINWATCYLTIKVSSPTCRDKPRGHFEVHLWSNLLAAPFLQLSCFHSLFLLAENFTDTTDLGKGEQEVQHVCHLHPNPSLSIHTLTAVQSTSIALFSYQFCHRVRCKAVLMKIRFKHHPSNGWDLKLNILMTWNVGLRRHNEKWFPVRLNCCLCCPSASPASQHCFRRVKLLYALRDWIRSLPT